MSMESRRICPKCRNEFAGAMEYCPVCMLRQAVGSGVQSGESFYAEDERQTAIEI